MIQLLHGDCLELMKSIPDGSVDMCLTDPPYGTTACKWDSVIPFAPMWEQLKRIVKPNGCIALFGSEPFSSALRMSNIKMFKYDWYWNKGQGLNFVTAKYRPLNDTECISIFSAGRTQYFPIMENAKIENIRPINKGSRNTEINGMKKLAKSAAGYDKTKRFPKVSLFFNSRAAECNSICRIHPTQKPVPLLEYLIKTYTLEGETVLDFTMGSGSTGVAAVNTGREFIGIEKDAGYFEIAKTRIAEAQENKVGMLL